MPPSSTAKSRAIQETLHLLKSPENAARLRSSIAELEAGEGTERDIDL
ncbi:type II toxin-antitoxin system Phd/YefM family antitoxin [Rhodovulum viride]|nr:hypothetical protein [Rhodovulum viride]